MSCHTWIYKKIELLTKSQKQALIEPEIKSLENWWGFKKGIEGITETVEKWWSNHDIDWLPKDSRTPREYAESLLKEYQSKLRRLKDSEYPFIEWIRIKRESGGSNLIKEYAGETWIYIACDTPFRLYGYYPTEKFTNLQCLLEFLEKQDPKKIGYYTDTEFVRGWTEELRGRIIKFWEEQGPDSLLVEWG